MNSTSTDTRHPDCTVRGEHAAHYLGRNQLGIPQRCGGYARDYAEDGDWWRETGWTGR